MLEQVAFSLSGANRNQAQLWTWHDDWGYQVGTIPLDFDFSKVLPISYFVVVIIIVYCYLFIYYDSLGLSQLYVHLRNRSHRLVD
jgi:hypothetical protein